MKKYFGKEFDKNEYRFEDIFSDEKHTEVYVRNNPIKTDERKNHNKFYLKKSVYIPLAHVGEFLGYLLATKSGIKTCETELYRRHRIRNLYDTGVISYVEAGKNDEIISARTLIRKYRKQTKLYPEQYWLTDIEEVFSSVLKVIAVSVK